MVAGPYTLTAPRAQAAQRTRSSLTLRAPRGATIVWPARADALRGASRRSLRTLQGKNHASLPTARPRLRDRCPTRRQELPRPTSVAHATHASRGPYPGTSLNMRATSHSELPFSLDTLLKTTATFSCMTGSSSATARRWPRVRGVDGSLMRSPSTSRQLSFFDDYGIRYAALILRHTRACVTVSCPSIVSAGGYVRRTRQAKPSKPQREE